MFIQTETTPNPNSLKFLPGCDLWTEGEPLFFEKGDPVPSAFLRCLLETVHSVLVGQDFLTITKTEEQEWSSVKPVVIGLLSDHLIRGEPLLDTEIAATEEIEESDSVIKQIRIILDTRVRPAVAQDGGDIVFDSFVEGVVFLKLKGACSGCPRSTQTLKMGIENMLKHYVPEVKEVRSIND